MDGVLRPWQGRGAGAISAVGGLYMHLSNGRHLLLSDTSV